MWMGEDTPLDCAGKCAEWDIHNDFEMIDRMPVYYGGTHMTLRVRNMWISITLMP